MIRQTLRAFTCVLCTAAVCGSLLAQSEKTITLRILNGKTGKLIEASNFLVRVDHDQTIHSNWAVQNDDGSIKLTVPAEASLLSIQGTYENTMQIYINCDAVIGKESPVERWYSIAEIMTSGVVAPNGCRKPSEAAKFKVVAKPGEFVLSVRRMSAFEQWRE